MTTAGVRGSQGFVIRLLSVEIYASAQKHGLGDDDILHATLNAMAIDRQDDDTVLYLGPARNGALLEVSTLRRDDGTELVIHAMSMRPSYRKLLPGGS